MSILGNQIKPLYLREQTKLFVIEIDVRFVLLVEDT